MIENTINSTPVPPPVLSKGDDMRESLGEGEPRPEPEPEPEPDPSLGEYGCPGIRALAVAKELAA